jgi:thiamine-phosphate pyrophosphorylase
MKKTDFSLYAIIDLDYLKAVGKDYKKSVVSVLRGGATIIQLRSKNAEDREFLDAALYVKKKSRTFKIPFVINDRVDVAYCVDADGVHIGACDMPLFEARKIMKKGKIIGLSAANEKEALAADKKKIDYIGLGPVFKTVIKNTKPFGVGKLKRLLKKLKKDVVAIGGIKEGNIESLKKAGVKNFAIISDILSAENIYEKTKRIKNIIKKNDK